MEKEPVRILVVGVAGNIGCALVHKIAMGGMLGLDQPVILYLLDIPPAAEALNEVIMVLEDAAFPLLRGVVATADVVEACTGVNIAIMLGGFPGEEGMERQDVMSLASALEQHAAANCRVLAVANFTNNNALFENEFAPSSALFVASSACDHMHDWFLGTPEGTWVPMRVYSDGSHNVPAGLICSFPVTCRNGEWTIVQGLSIDELSWKKCLQTMILGMILMFFFIIYSLLRGALY